MELNFNWKFDIKEMQDMESLNHEVDQEAKGVTIGKTLFMEKFNVSSEREYKEQMMKKGHIMKHSAYGTNEWEDQVKGLKDVYHALNDNGSYIDRYGVCLDWIMGVPEEYRHTLPAGSGLILKNEDE